MTSRCAFVSNMLKASTLSTGTAAIASAFNAPFHFFGSRKKSLLQGCEQAGARQSRPSADVGFEWGFPAELLGSVWTMTAASVCCFTGANMIAKNQKLKGLCFLVLGFALIGLSISSDFLMANSNFAQSNFKQQGFDACYPCVQQTGVTCPENLPNVTTEFATSVKYQAAVGGVVAASAILNGFITGRRCPERTDNESNGQVQTPLLRSANAAP